jgi:hypothetical protein
MAEMYAGSKFMGSCGGKNTAQGGGFFSPGTQ